MKPEVDWSSMAGIPEVVKQNRRQSLVSTASRLHCDQQPEISESVTLPENYVQMLPEEFLIYTALPQFFEVHSSANYAIISARYKLNRKCTRRRNKYRRRNTNCLTHTADSAAPDANNFARDNSTRRRKGRRKSVTIHRGTQ